jgi:thiol-disulfide isomerase/thioredoxin
MTQQHPPLILCGFLLTALTGCETKSVPLQSATSTSVSKPETGDSGNSSAAHPSSGIQLIDMDWTELQSLVSLQKGKIVVVDIWSTSCGPCMKEYPHFLELRKKYPDDVKAISFDVENVGQKDKLRSIYRERVLTFLQNHPDSHVIHCLCKSSARDLYIETDLNSLPAIYVYSRDGTLAKRFDLQSYPEGITYERDVVPFVDQLIAVDSTKGPFDSQTDQQHDQSQE